MDEKFAFKWGKNHEARINMDVWNALGVKFVFFKSFIYSYLIFIIREKKGRDKKWIKEFVFIGYDNELHWY